jgi:hypothetical protein
MRPDLPPKKRDDERRAEPQALRRRYVERASTPSRASPARETPVNVSATTARFPLGLPTRGSRSNPRRLDTDLPRSIDVEALMERKHVLSKLSK